MTLASWTIRGIYHTGEGDPRHRTLRIVGVMGSGSFADDARCSSDVVIALEGSWGTRSEVSLAVQYGRPVVVYLQDPVAIPQLPETVPVVSRREDVQSFVREALGRAP